LTLTESTKKRKTKQYAEVKLYGFMLQYMFGWPEQAWKEFYGTTW